MFLPFNNQCQVPKMKKLYTEKLYTFSQSGLSDSSYVKGIEGLEVSLFQVSKEIVSHVHKGTVVVISAIKIIIRLPDH